jgi:hypothetical protein
LLSRFRGTGGKLFDVLAPGLYAWGTTVGWPVSQRFAPLGARISALVALVSLVSGSALVVTSVRLARAFGLWVFLGACIATWAWFSVGVSTLRLDPVQGVLGSLGWALFAISWAGDAASKPAAPPISADAPLPVASPESRTPRAPDPARRYRNVPRAAAAVLTLVTTVAALPMILAWWVASLERALLAHAVALAAAIALVTFAVDLFEPRSRAEEAGFDASRKPERRIAAALPAFIALTALLVLGAAYTLLR